MSNQNNEVDIFAMFANCLETSNLLLKTFSEETQPGLKKDQIIKMIEANSNAMVIALEQPLPGSTGEAEFQIDVADVSPDLLAKIFGENVQLIEISDLAIHQAVGLLEEIQDAYFLKDKIQPVINILKNGI